MKTVYRPTTDTCEGPGDEGVRRYLEAIWAYYRGAMTMSDPRNQVARWVDEHGHVRYEVTICEAAGLESDKVVCYVTEFAPALHSTLPPAPGKKPYAAGYYRDVA